jgi:TonB-linked SusC/RagA family outer membrane protein
MERVIPDLIRNLSLKQTKKLFRVMRLTAILLLSACLQVSANGKAQGITISEKNASLDKIFTAIKKQTGYDFLYTREMLQATKKVSINLKNASLQNVLDECMKDQPLTYTIINNTVIIKPREAVPNEEANLRNEPPPPIDVKGKITNENGEPVLASIQVKGTSQGTTTNADGYFELKNVDENATLVITASNIETREVKLNGRSDLDVVSVKMKIESLNEVVINKGYYTERQRVSVSNVGKVTSKEIERQPINNPLLALEGRVPGLVVTQSTGIPGGGISIRIQGQNSLSRGNDPLYVIDGVPFISQLPPDLSGPAAGILGDNGNTNPFTQVGGGNPLSFLNPDDIESIEILKDADATSIYGSRAAAGAILITTKKGKPGQTKVDVSFQQGFGKVGHFLSLLKTQQYLQMRHEAKANDNAALLPTDYDINGTWDSTRYTDWQKVLLGGTAKYTNAQASVSGGTINTQFIIGTGYHNETSVFPGDLADKKGSVHFNINHSNLSQKFRVQLSGNYIVDDNKLINRDLTSTAIQLSPVAPNLYNADGSINWALDANGNSTWYNPLAYFNGKYTKKVNNLLSNGIVSCEVITNLELKLNLGYSNLQSDETSINPSSVNAPELKASTPRTSRFAISGNNSWIVEPQVHYKVKVKENAFDLLVGSTFLEDNLKMESFNTSGFNSDLVMNNIRAASSVSVTQSIISKYNYSALYGRINYNLKNKYLLNITGRRDGSSRFGSKNLFHNFGSLGAGWIFSSEDFVSNAAPFLSFGKLKGSFGTTGNDQIGDYQFMDLYNVISGPQPYQNAIGLTPAGLPNPYLQWEETKKLQIGAELGFDHDKIFLNVNYYHNRSSNQLQSYFLPFLAGFNSIQQNLNATIKNVGWEIAVTSNNIQRTNFKWLTTFNLTVSKNKLVSYPDLEKSSYSNTYVVGQPITLVKAFKYIGIDSQTGLFTFLDSKGNTTSAPTRFKDQIVFDNSFPDLFGGIENNFQYRGFELSFFFQFVKQKAFNYKFGNRPGAFSSSNTGILRANQPTSVLDRWQKTGDNTFFQKFSSSYSSDLGNAYTWATLSDMAFSDASFIRLKNLSLSWSIPKKVETKFHLTNARFYLQGQNLMTITNYIGLDPENKSTNNLPPLKVITFGIQLSL